MRREMLTTQLRDTHQMFPQKRKTDCGCELPRNGPSQSTQKIPDHQTRKNAKRIVAVSCGMLTTKSQPKKIPDHQKRKNAKRIVAVSYATRKSKPQIKIDANLPATTITERATQRANLSHKEDPNATRPGFSCRCEAKLRARDSKKRRRYGTRADRSSSLRLVRGPGPVAPSA